MLAGKGFKPHEELLITYNRGSKKIEINLIVDDDGTMRASINPAAMNYMGGQTSLSIDRKQTGESATLSYLWGILAKAKSKLMLQNNSKSTDHEIKS